MTRGSPFYVLARVVRDRSLPFAAIYATRWGRRWGRKPIAQYYHSDFNLLALRIGGGGVRHTASDFNYLGIRCKTLSTHFVQALFGPLAQGPKCARRGLHV